MGRMEEGTRQFREERDEDRSRDERRGWEGREERGYGGQGVYRSEGYRGAGSEGWDERDGDYGRGRTGPYGEDRYEAGRAGSQGRMGGQYGQPYGQRDTWRQGERQYGGSMYGSRDQYGGAHFGGEYGGAYPYGQYGQSGGGQWGGGQYGQYGGGGQAGYGPYGQGGYGGSYGQGRGHTGGGGQTWGGGPWGGQGGQWGRPAGYGQDEGYYGGRRSFQGREEERATPDLGEQISQFGGAMAGRVRRMFKSPKGYKRSDERIREDVCDHLSVNDQLDPSDIEVSVANGEVTLTGTVPARFMKWQAEQIIDNVSGVMEIHNQLRVQRQDQPAAQQTSGMSTSAANTQGSSPRTQARS